MGLVYLDEIFGPDEWFTLKQHFVLREHEPGGSRRDSLGDVEQAAMGLYGPWGNLDHRGSTDVRGGRDTTVLAEVKRRLILAAELLRRMRFKK